MPGQENFISSLKRKFRPAQGEVIPTRESDLDFAMSCNGYNATRGTDWKYDHNARGVALSEFKGQQVAFFGPGNPSSKFYLLDDFGAPRLLSALSQEAVTDVIGKFRPIDEAQAARIAFILGGIVRHMVSTNPLSEDIEEKTANAVKFVANMTILGNRNSTDAIASAMAMYVISKGPIENSNYFSNYVRLMSQAIKDDPIHPLETSDLGLSQVARLRNFMDRIADKDPESLPDIGKQKEAFGEFPTVGAEFHFPGDTPEKQRNFWQRLAILNMSQYQRGSYIQLSRNDRDVIEVRMNPSIYPVAIATWNHMKLLLPELSQAFFTITINRTDKNFDWTDEVDQSLLNKLRAIGFLTYASIFENVPRTEGTEEVDFGNIYLGQTVKMHNGKYNFSGNWSGGEGKHGQLAVYTGFGGNFPHLAYYLSMALAKPYLLDRFANNPLFKKSTLADALKVRPKYRRNIFTSIQRGVENNTELRQVYNASKKIMRLLNP